MQAVAEALAQAPEFVLDPEKRYEFVDGQPKEKEMPGARHSGVGTRLIIELGIYLRSHPIGCVYGEASFQIGKREHIPDVAFVALERIPPEGEPETKWPFAPDLAVEVISPNDIFDDVFTKMREYFAAGVKQVWLISTEHRVVIVHESPTHSDMLEEDRELTCESLLPGFRCRVADLFKSPAKT